MDQGIKRSGLESQFLKSHVIWPLLLLLFLISEPKCSYIPELTHPNIHLSNIHPIRPSRHPSINSLIPLPLSSLLPFPFSLSLSSSPSNLFFHLFIHPIIEQVFFWYLVSARCCVRNHWGVEWWMRSTCPCSHGIYSMVGIWCCCYYWTHTRVIPGGAMEVWIEKCFMEVSGMKFSADCTAKWKWGGGFDAVGALVISGIRDYADCVFKVSLDKGTYVGNIVSLHKIYTSRVVRVLELWDRQVSCPCAFIV